MSEELKPCPFCGNTDELYGSGDGQGTYCDNCGAEGPSYVREGKPVGVWNDRCAPVAAHELDVEAERREPPALPRYLLDMIGEYGMARTDSVGQLEVQHRWETLIGGIKRYASDFARSAAQSTAPEHKTRFANSECSAPVSTELAGDAPPRTFMTDTQAFDWSWAQLKKDLNAERWSAGDEVQSRAFYKYGWDYRAQYERQRVAPSPNNSPVGADKETK